MAILLQARRIDEPPCTRCGSTGAFVLAILVLSMSAAFAVSPKPPLKLAARTPAGFDELLRPQTNLVDVLFGGRRVGSALATFEPGSLRFSDAKALVALLPAVGDPGPVLHALAQRLSTNANLVCADKQPENCGHLVPDVAGIIFDETHFRAEIFVNPNYLRRAQAGQPEYLPSPASGLSLADTVGGAISGSGQGKTTYSIQNRAVIGYRDGRLAAQMSQSSDLGFRTDTLAASIDGPGMRYLAGLFWTHDRDFYGQRRIYGVSIGTQTDTRADREQVTGSTLAIFLPRRSSVDILRDGRLLASKSYDAGNQALDTSALPDGSYSVTLRIHEVGGPTREERQFFVKNRSIPMEGEPAFFLDGGILARDSRGPLPGTLQSFFVEAGGALRLAGDWAIDAAATGTVRGASLELGSTYFSDWLRTHAAIYAATPGRYGALVTGEIHILPTLLLFLNARKTWGRVRATIPQLSQDFSFDEVDLTTANQLTGNSAQLSGNLTWVVGNAQIGVTASYLDSTFGTRVYSYGPSIDWPFWNDDAITVTLNANFAQSNYGSHAFMGLRLQLNRDGYSLIGQGGGESARNSAGTRETGVVGSLTGTTTVADVLSSELTASAGYARNLGASAIALQGQLRGPYGLYSAETEHEVGSGTRYSASFVSGLAVAGDEAALGGADASDSGIVVSLSGKVKDTTVDVLINGAPVGRLSVGHSLPVFLPPYKVYSVRLQPVNAPSIEFDTAERSVSLFPGNVESLVWDIEPVIDIFGRAVRVDGRPVANARIKGAKTAGATDENGYFQLEIAESGSLTFETPGAGDCRVALGNVVPKNSYAGVGTLTCR